MGVSMKEKKQKLGELLIQMKIINADQLADALGEQANLQARNAQRQFRLGEILISRRAITLVQLAAALRIQANSRVGTTGVSLQTLGRTQSSQMTESRSFGRFMTGIRFAFGI